MMHLLSRNEELLLLATWRLQEGAYSLAIQREMARVLGREVSIGAVYVPLERLARQGFLATREGAPTNRRGGRRKRFYRLTAKGHAALAQVQQVQQRAWADLPALGWEGQA